MIRLANSSAITTKNKVVGTVTIGDSIPKQEAQMEIFSRRAVMMAFKCTGCNTERAYGAGSGNNKPAERQPLLWCESCNGATRHNFTQAKVFTMFWERDVFQRIMNVKFASQW
jgi:hypothetical protein